MNILTPTGYRDVADCVVGDEVCAFDTETGAPIVNTIELIERIDLAEWRRWWSVESTVPPFKFYKINGTWTLNSEQSIWRNGTNVCHVRDLVVGDVVYGDVDNAVAITSIEEVKADSWYRFEISGDHSYITDGLTQHNASRFWVGGTGTWDSSTTTHWAATTGGAGGSSVPGSVDTVTFDGASGGGTVTLNFGGTITVQSITIGAFTGTWDNSVNNNNITLSASTGLSGTGSGTRTIKLGSATYTFTNTTASSTLVSFGTITGLTFDAGTSILNITGSLAAGAGQTLALGALTWNTVKISASRFNSGMAITGGPTITLLDIEAAATVSIGTAATTITTLTQNAQLALVALTNATLTLTNAPTLVGTASAPLAILNSSLATGAITATVSCASGTFSGTWSAIEGITFSGGATFSFTNSLDLGKNSGATITAPSAGAFLANSPIVLQRGTPY